MKNYNLVELFAIPVFRSNIDLDESTLETVKSVPLRRYDSGNGFCSIDRRILLLPEFTYIRDQIISCLQIYLGDVLKVSPNTIFELQNSWISKHSPNDISNTHDHINSTISGVLYLKTTPDSGNIVFHKERMWQNVFPRTTYVDFTEYTTVTAPTWEITPEPGELIFFPSSLAHSVTPNLSNEDRYCLAFNFYAKGPFGRYDNSICELTL